MLRAHEHRHGARTSLIRTAHWAHDAISWKRHCHCVQWVKLQTLDDPWREYFVWQQIRYTESPINREVTKGRPCRVVTISCRHEYAIFMSSRYLLLCVDIDNTQAD
jgi:hypothetical protein